LVSSSRVRDVGLPGVSTSAKTHTLDRAIVVVSPSLR
jgi:hypothetical protein